MTWYWCVLLYLVGSYPLCLSLIFICNWIEVKARTDDFSSHNHAIGVVFLVSPLMWWFPVVVGISVGYREFLQDRLGPERIGAWITGLQKKGK